MCYFLTSYPIKGSTLDLLIMRNDKKNLIVDLSVEFALDIIDFCDILEEQRHFILARKLFKSGTSIGANIHEAQNAESKDDFIHKMKIAAKEADETKYWLILCERSQKYPFESSPKEKLQSLINILSKIISTSKRKQSP
jgi:four helix bundle protein